MRHIGTQTLATRQLILRRHEMADAEDIFANWASDPVAAHFWSWDPHKSITETRALVSGWSREYEKPDYYHWAVVERESGRAIGYIYLDSIDEAEGSAAVHYLLARAHWNRGLMTEACRRVIEFAFSEAGFRKIRSWHHADNPASGRVMLKCGMRFVKAEFRALDCARLSGEYHYYEMENR